MSREEIIGLLSEDWDKALKAMRDALSTDIPLLASVNDSILSHSGKMLRPLLSLLCARACGGACTQDSYRFAASAELLHNATLLHDDVADEADTRRGNPTLRQLMGPGAAVLVGDFWLSRAVEQVEQSEHQSYVTKLFARTLSDLAEGEMLQLQKAGTADTTMADYLRIIYCKTASLFVASCACGAISTGAPQEMVQAVSSYASALGTAFQIKDDILDYVGSEELGKPVGIDLLEQKITLPLLLAMEGTPQEKSIREQVSSLGQHPECCASIRDFVVSNGGVKKAEEVLESYIQKAIDALEVLPASREKDALVSVARLNSTRNS